jgi:hypothetical protein
MECRILPFMNNGELKAETMETVELAVLFGSYTYQTIGVSESPTWSGKFFDFFLVGHLAMGFIGIFISNAFKTLPHKIAQT